MAGPFCFQDLLRHDVRVTTVYGTTYTGSLVALTPSKDKSLKDSQQEVKLLTLANGENVYIHCILILCVCMCVRAAQLPRGGCWRLAMGYVRTRFYKGFLARGKVWWGRMREGVCRSR